GSAQWRCRFRPAMAEWLDRSRDRNCTDAVSLRWLDGAKFPAIAARRSRIQFEQSPHHENGVAYFAVFTIPTTGRVYRSRARAHSAVAWGTGGWRDDKRSARA